MDVRAVDATFEQVKTVVEEFNVEAEKWIHFSPVALSLPILMERAARVHRELNILSARIRPFVDATAKASDPVAVRVIRLKKLETSFYVNVKFMSTRRDGNGFVDEEKPTPSSTSFPHAAEDSPMRTLISSVTEYNNTIKRRDQDHMVVALNGLIQEEVDKVINAANAKALIRQEAELDAFILSLRGTNAIAPTLVIAGMVSPENTIAWADRARREGFRVETQN